MKWVHQWLLLLMICFCVNKLYAQKKAIQLSFAQGKILDIYPNFPERKNHQIASLAYQWQNNSGYSARFGFAQNAINLSFHDFGNRAILGLGVGLQYELQLHQHLSKKLQLIERIGMGGIWNTKPYHYADNPENIVMGSHLAALVSVAFGLDYRLTPTLNLSAEGVFWHSSNMHARLPNVGMNTPSFRVGLAHAFKINDEKAIQIAKLQLPNQWELQTRFALGFNEAGGTARPVNTPLYWKQLFSLGVAYRYKSIHRVSVNLETYYDGANRVWNEALERDLANPYLASSVVALMIGHEFIYGHFGFVVNAGLNLYNPTYNYLLSEVFDNLSRGGLKKYVPGRFAMRYYLNLPEKTTASSFIQFGVKSHFTQADFLEIGIGMIISKPKVPRK
jgi:hypothetical protein